MNKNELQPSLRYTNFVGDKLLTGAVGGKEYTVLGDIGGQWGYGAGVQTAYNPLVLNRLWEHVKLCIFALILGLSEFAEKFFHEVKKTQYLCGLGLYP